MAEILSQDEIDMILSQEEVDGLLSNTLEIGELSSETSEESEEAFDEVGSGNTPIEKLIKGESILPKDWGILEASIRISSAVAKKPTEDSDWVAVKAGEELVIDFDPMLTDLPLFLNILVLDPLTSNVYQNSTRLAGRHSYGIFVSNITPRSIKLTCGKTSLVNHPSTNLIKQALIRVVVL